MVKNKGRHLEELLQCLYMRWRASKRPVSPNQCRAMASAAAKSSALFTSLKTAFAHAKKYIYNN